MPKHRKLLILAAFLVVLALAPLFYFRHATRPPEAARLLPEGDTLVYANLRPVHLWDAGQSRPPQRDSDYQKFIDQTGIQIERDLDEVAMSRRDTPDGRDTESSEIFVGRFDQQRLRNYLENISAQRDRYRDHMIYLVLHEGHSVRVSILDADRVAVTNMASSDPMHEIIDGSLSPADGPSLEQSYYRRVPLASLGWMISRIPGDSRSPQLPNGWSFDFLENTVVVASLRYKGDLLLRADVIAPTGDDAKRVVDSAGNFLSMYRAVSQSVGARGSDPDVKSAIDSIQAQQNKNVAVFTATLSQRFLKKLVSDAQSGIAAPSPTPAPTPKPQRKRHKRRG